MPARPLLVPLLVASSALLTGCGWGAETPVATSDRQAATERQRVDRGGAAAAPAASDRADSHTGRVQRVVDGDTVKVSGVGAVRLVQIDTPELRPQPECFARPARRTLAGLAPVGRRVELRHDPSLDRRDRFGRLLAYLYVDGRNINVELVRMGVANVWFYRGQRGEHAAELMRARRSARAAPLGLWRSCPRATHQVTRALDTGPAG